MFSRPDSAPLTLPSPSEAAPEGITLVITERVRPGQTEPYERWAWELHGVLETQPGFLGLNVLRDRSAPVPEYITLVRFDRPEHLQAWRSSSVYRTALRELPRFTASEVQYREAAGLEQWFDQPARSAQPAPPLWKNVVVGFVGVYPLILLFTWLSGPVTQGWPWWAAILPSAFLATLCLNWPVLPLLSRALRGWLYPPAPQQ